LFNEKSFVIRKINKEDVHKIYNLTQNDLDKWALFSEGVMVFFSSNKDAVTDFKDSLSRS
jgi:hypothetical protein